MNKKVLRIIILLLIVLIALIIGIIYKLNKLEVNPPGPRDRGIFGKK